MSDWLRWKVRIVFASMKENERTFEELANEVLELIESGPEITYEPLPEEHPASASLFQSENLWLKIRS